MTNQQNVIAAFLLNGIFFALLGATGWFNPSMSFVMEIIAIVLALGALKSDD